MQLLKHERYKANPEYRTPILDPTLESIRKRNTFNRYVKIDEDNRQVSTSPVRSTVLTSRIANHTASDNEQEENVEVNKDIPANFSNNDELPGVV